MQTFVTLAAFAASASAYSLTVQNNCDQDAYIWSCGDKLGEMQQLKAGKTWSEDYYSKEGDSAGPSIYVSDDTSNTDGNIAQLEYFYQEAISKVWWDISLINGNPFPDIAMGSDLEDIPYDACKAVQCQGDNCNGIVYKTHEQLAGTHDCPPSNLVMKLCDSTGQWKAGAPSSSTPAPKPVSVPSYSHAAPPSYKPSAPAHSVVASPPSVPSPSSSVSVASAPSYSKAHAPKPEATTPAPAATKTATKGGAFVQENNDGEVIVHTAYATTVVTAVVTQTASPQAYGAALNEGSDGSVHGKREAHGHAHAHANGFRSRVRRHQHSS